jgi:hypothetical protein
MFRVVGIEAKLADRDGAYLVDRIIGNNAATSASSRAGHIVAAIMWRACERCMSVVAEGCPE